MKIALISFCFFWCCFAYAETYIWVDDQGVTNFTDNANLIPKKYRKKALENSGSDITTSDPDVRRSVNESIQNNQLRETQRQEALESQRAAEEKKEIAIKLAKTKCRSDIPDDCGPGRHCLHSILSKTGVCKSEAEAARIIDKSNQAIRDMQQQQRDMDQESRDRQLDRKLNDIKDKQDSIDRRLKWGW